MDGFLILGLGAAALSAAFFGLAAVLQASAVRELGAITDNLWWLAINMWRQPALLTVVIGYLLGFWLHALAIWLLPLYLAQAAISLSLPLTAWVAAHRLGESMGPGRWAAVISIVVGLAFLAVGSGAAGHGGHGVAMVAALWGTALALGVLGLTGVFDGPGGCGVLAGVGYAGTAIGVRGVTGLDTVSLLSGLAVPILGVLAFWLYSMGMDRGDVAISSGLVIVGQTMIPTVLGLTVLGDGWRAGYGTFVAVGLAAATLGALALARTQVPLEDAPAEAATAAGQ